MRRWGPPPQRPVPAKGEAHVWRVSLDEPVLPVAWLRSLLSVDERERAGRFHFDRDRDRFVAGRGTLRLLLGRYLSEDPGEIAFVYGRRGKPALAAPRGLRFNVSHSGGLALLAFTDECDVGVDLERERPLPEAEEIAERFFSPREAGELHGLPEEERPAAFFRCWTRKEAWIKATGDGLSRALDAFDVSLLPGEEARLRRVTGEPVEAGRWRLVDLEPGAGFVGALAVCGEPSEICRWSLDESTRRDHGPRGEGRSDRLQGRGEPRGAVLDLAR